MSLGSSSPAHPEAQKNPLSYRQLNVHKFPLVGEQPASKYVQQIYTVIVKTY